jgi:hypothetical protein
MTKIEFLKAQLGDTLDWYTRSEEKAKFLLSVDTAVVSVCTGLIFVGADDAAFVAAFLRGPMLWLLLALGLTVVLSFAGILDVLWARQATRDTNAPQADRLWFFGDIAEMSRERHATAIVALSDATLSTRLEAMLISQCHTLSVNVVRKHRALNWAISSTMAAVVLLFALAATYALALPQ